ncbi:MAG: sulfur reduction protein DsrE [Gammaproteobacteria bacterium]|nr:MAG: sulfur reduction protein DsrE [Gammaproteobacteria bacterium]
MVQTTDYVGTLFDNETTNPNKITVALTMGCKVLEKGNSATIILMVDAVSLALPNKLDNVDIGAPFKPAKELLEGFLAAGGNVQVCKACMIHNGVDEAKIDGRFGVVSADDVVDLVMNAKGSLQLS